MGDGSPATGRYMYAICRRLEPSATAGVAGLGGGPVELVADGDLVAVVSTVALDEYGEEGLRANLEDLAWLERAARGHDAVVQSVAVHAPTAPLRLATICLDDDAVRARLREWHDALAEVLDRIDGRMEWSVKVLAPPRTAAAEPAAAVAGGAAYLMRKKAENEARHHAEDDAVRSAEAVHQALVRHAVASRALPPQDPRLTGHVGTMVHNGAYLVESADTDAFAGEVDRLRADHPGVVVECGGPWPPYSFATLEQQ